MQSSVCCFLMLFPDLSRFSQLLLRVEAKNPRFVYTVDRDGTLIANKFGSEERLDWEVESGVTIRAVKNPDRWAAWDVVFRSTGPIPRVLIDLVYWSVGVGSAHFAHPEELRVMIEKEIDETEDLVKLEKLVGFLEELGMSVSEKRKEKLKQSHEHKTS